MNDYLSCSIYAVVALPSNQLNCNQSLLLIWMMPLTKYLKIPRYSLKALKSLFDFGENWGSLLPLYIMQGIDREISRITRVTRKIKLG